jgi:hypothetical protein
MLRWALHCALALARLLALHSLRDLRDGAVLEVAMVRKKDEALEAEVNGLSVEIKV